MRSIVLAAALLLALTALLLLLPGLLIGPSLDPSVFTQVASAMREGATLYVDAWDHKPPGIYLLLAAFQTLLPFLDPWPVSWLVTLLATAGSGIALLRTLRGLGVGPVAALLGAAAAVAALAQYLTALGGGLTESVAVLPMAVALHLALGAVNSLARAATVGALLAVSVLLSLPMAPAAVVVGLAVAIQALRGGRWMEAAGLLVGGAAPVAFVVAWLLSTGAWEAALDAILGYATAYRAANAELGARLSAPVITWTLLSHLVLLVPAALGATRGVRDPGARRQAVVIGLAWVVLSLVLVVYQGRFFAHYAIPLALPLGVMAGMGFQRLGVLLSRAHRPLVRAGLLAPFVGALVISLAAAAAGGRMEWLPVWRDHERSERVADAIRASTGAEDAIWVWGNEPQLYLLADRPAATAYAYLYPLVTPGYTTPAMIQAALADLEADPPTLVVDAGSRAPGIVGFQQLLIPRPLTSDGRDLDILDPLRDFVGERYDESATVDGWVIYALRDAAP